MKPMTNAVHEAYDIRVVANVDEGFIESKPRHGAHFCLIPKRAEVRAPRGPRGLEPEGVALILIFAFFAWLCPASLLWAHV